MPRFEGSNPHFKQEVDSGEFLDFDSKFEGGNLDKVIIITPHEYDLYMRVDSNTYGHH